MQRRYGSWGPKFYSVWSLLSHFYWLNKIPNSFLIHYCIDAEPFNQINYDQFDARIFYFESFHIQKLSIKYL